MALQQDSVAVGRGDVPTLAGALDQLGWGPRDLAREVNGWLSTRGRDDERIHPTTAYKWVSEAYCPYGALPNVCASVLSCHLGVHVLPEQLWPKHIRARRPSTRVVAVATDDLDGVTRTLTELATGAQPWVPEHEMLAAVVDTMRSPKTGLPPSRTRERVYLPQAQLISKHVGELRKLDDRHGGGALSLRYVTTELTNVLDLLRPGNGDETVSHALLISVADLAQLIGWMQFDAGEVEAAGAYLLIGIRVARAVGDDARAANIAGMYAYVVAQHSRGANALLVLDEAEKLSVPSPLLKARIAGRAATAHASLGDLTQFRRRSDQAHRLLGAAGTDETSAYLYYLNPAQLNSEMGHGLVMVAGRTELFRKQLLHEAIHLLTPLTSMGIGDRELNQRSALLHGCQLAGAYLMLRDLDAAVEAVRTQIARIPEVQSVRCVRQLRTLRNALARRSRSHVVADFLPELDHALELV